jgi:nuclear GTP-binding protein
MLKGGKAIRDSQGKVVQAAEYQSSEAKVARVAPNRKWFGN